MTRQEQAMNTDHTDSPHGYAHITLSIERGPGVDTEAIFDAVCEVVAGYCHTDEDNTCSIEHYESMTGMRCLFPEDGEPMTTHTHEVPDSLRV